jgi:hypothetical protein
MFWGVKDTKRVPYNMLRKLAVIAMVLSIIFLVLNIWELHDKYNRASQSAFNYSSNLAACLNGQTLYDRKSGIALFTERAIAIDVGLQTNNSGDKKQ